MGIPICHVISPNILINSLVLSSSFFCCGAAVPFLSIFFLPKGNIGIFMWFNVAFEKKSLIFVLFSYPII